MNKIVVALGCDHAALDMKGIIKTHLESKGYVITDVGTYGPESCDYPDFAFKVANEVANRKAEKGIIICGTGIGVAIAANKVHGIRCATCNDLFTAEMTRRHNDANVLAFGARVVGSEVAKRIADIFLETPFEGGRHAERVQKIMDIEKNQSR